MDYLDRIKKLKNEKKIKNDELSEMTGIPLGTLSKILARISDSPKFFNIVSICEALGCSIDYIVTGIPENKNNYTLNDDEISFMEMCRRLDAHGREMLLLVASKEAERISLEEIQGTEERSENCDNDKAKSKTYRKSRRADMVSFKKSPTNAGENETDNIFSIKAAEMQNKSLGISYTGQSAVPLKRRIALYDMPVSAGCGIFLDEDSATEIMIPDTAKSSEADFALKISGNSMEPRYKNGDYLLIKNTDTIEVGEIGVFVLDGEGYVKVYGGDTLISLNRDYSPILLKDFGEVRCVGVVTGKLKKR